MPFAVGSSRGRVLSCDSCILIQQHVEQCAWYEGLIKPAEDVVTELRFSSMGLDPVTTHPSACHALRHFSMKHLYFLIMSKIVFSDIPLLFAATYLWFWVGFLTLLVFSFLSPPQQWSPWKVFHPLCPVDCLKGGQKPSPVHLVCRHWLRWEASATALRRTEAQLPG